VKEKVKVEAGSKVTGEERRGWRGRVDKVEFRKGSDGISVGNADRVVCSTPALDVGYTVEGDKTKSEVVVESRQVQSILIGINERIDGMLLYVKALSVDVVHIKTKNTRYG